MLTINLELLHKKLEGFDSLAIKDKYIQSSKLFGALSVADSKMIDDSLKNVGFASLYKDAENTIQEELSKGLVIMNRPSDRQIVLLYPDPSKDTVLDFFEVSTLAKKMSPSVLDQSLIIGFLMDEQRMNAIQIFNHLNPKISEILSR